MIELRRIDVAYDGQRVLHGVDLRVEEAELVLVAGRTGVGKSTLLGLFNGLVPSFTGARVSGQVLIDDVDVTAVPPRDRAHLVGHVGQDPAATFVTDTVEEELAFGPEQLGLDPATMRRRVEDTLDLLGIADLRDRDLRTLSGGQQQRVAIGAVLTMHPRVLVLDEPTSALDPTAAEDVLATLSRLVTDLGLSVVLAEHRLERVVPFADAMVLVHEDGTVASGDPAAMMAEAPVAPPIVHIGRVAGWEPLPLSVREARRRARSLDPIEPPAMSSVGDSESIEACVVERLTVTYGRHTALREVSTRLYAGSVTALMGRNGAGKSTLLWAIHGAGRRDGGTVHVAGGRAGLVPQTPADLLYLESVAEECAAADREHATAEAVAGDDSTGTTSTLELLDALAPGIDANLHPRDLSEGQRLALVLAIVLRSDPSVLLLDEPTRGLDYPGKTALARILAQRAARGVAVLVATHDVEFVAEAADRVLVLADGDLVADGPTAEVVAQTPAFAPQALKILGPGWLTAGQFETAMAR